MKIITLVGVPGSMPRTRGTILRTTDDTLMRGNQRYVQARSIDSCQGRFGDSKISCIIFNKIVSCKFFTLETLKRENSLNGSVLSRSNWNLEVLVFDRRSKLEYPEKTFRRKG